MDFSKYTCYSMYIAAALLHTEVNDLKNEYKKQGYKKWPRIRSKEEKSGSDYNYYGEFKIPKRSKLNDSVKVDELKISDSFFKEELKFKEVDFFLMNFEKMTERHKNDILKLDLEKQIQQSENLVDRNESKIKKTFSIIIAIDGILNVYEIKEMKNVDVTKEIEYTIQKWEFSDFKLFYLNRILYDSNALTAVKCPELVRLVNHKGTPIACIRASNDQNLMELVIYSPSEDHIIHKISCENVIEYLRDTIKGLHGVPMITVYSENHIISKIELDPYDKIRFGIWNFNKK